MTADRRTEETEYDPTEEQRRRERRERAKLDDKQRGLLGESPHRGRPAPRSQRMQGWDDDEDWEDDEDDGEDSDAAELLHDANDDDTDDDDEAGPL